MSQRRIRRAEKLNSVKLVYTACEYHAKTSRADACFEYPRFWKRHQFNQDMQQKHHKVYKVWHSLHSGLLNLVWLRVLDHKNHWYRQRIDAFEMWRRLLWIPWTARLTNISILEEVYKRSLLGRAFMLFYTRTKLLLFGHYFIKFN